MAKEFRRSICKMPMDARNDVGTEIRSTLRQLKYETYLAIKSQYDNKDNLIDLLNKVKILVDECLEDGFLLVKGPYTIIQPRKRLKEILEQLEKPIVIQQNSLP